MESKIKKINNVEYFFTDDEFYIQDFIRYPVVINYNSLDWEGGYSKKTIENVLKNRSMSSINGVIGSKHKISIITGESDFPNFLPPETSVIGVYDGFLNDMALFSVVGGVSSPMLKKIEGKKSLPVGLFDIRSDSIVLDFWRRKSLVGVYFLPSYDLKCFSSICCGNSVVPLYAHDSAAGGIHFAFSFLESSKILLCGADLTFSSYRPNSIQVGDRFIFPEHMFFLNYLHGVCYILARNNIEIVYVRETMLEIPFIKSINKEEVNSLIEEWLDD